MNILYIGYAIFAHLVSRQRTYTVMDQVKDICVGGKRIFECIFSIGVGHDVCLMNKVEVKSNLSASWKGKVK